MDDFWIEKEEKKINKVKVAVTIVIAILLLLIATSIILYYTNKDIHEWMDKNIFNKEIFQDTSNYIDLEDEHTKVFAFNKNIATLYKNKMKIYNGYGSQEAELEIGITNPITSTSNRFMVIGENLGKKFYVIEDKKIAWEAEIEGEISQININKNGYVVVVITGTSYKSVIAIYDNSGKLLFKKYLSDSRLADVDISNDNKYLALAEVDTSGTVIQSNINVVSIEKAQTDPKNSVEKVYKGQGNSLIMNIEYQDREKLVCMYDDSVHVISEEKDEVIEDYKNKKVAFSSIDLTNNMVEISEQSSGLFTADSVVKITNINDNSVKDYTVNTVTKEIFTYDNIIALNLGSEIEFINTDGWLVKRYIASQEITNMVISNSIAGIVYRDKIEIVNF